MRTLTNLCLLFVILLAACSKKSGSEPQANIVTINGTQYPTVKIGSQTWMAVNYNGAGGLDIANSPAAVYGKLYNFSEATSVSLPAGWRLPTESDFNNLLTIAGGTKNSLGSVIGANYLSLISTTGWQTNGSNSLGFNAYPAGYITGNGPSTIDLGWTTLIWCATLDSEQHNTALILTNSTSSGYLTNYAPTEYASVRFVKDN